MKNKLFNSGVKAVLFLLVLIVTVSIFVKYSEPVSSEKIESDVKATSETVVTQAAPTQEPALPVVSKSVAFAESMPVSDLPVIAMDTTGMKIVPIDLEELREKNKAGKNEINLVNKNTVDEEINKKNREILRVIDPAAPRSIDKALSSEKSFRKMSPEVLPTPTTSFEGISFGDTSAIGQGFLPPDTVGEVGPNHFVQAVNSAFRIWDKLGTPLTPTISLGTLFSSISGPCASSTDGDPVVIYDQLADRWLISQFCFETSARVSITPTHQLIAVSKTGDPTGSFFLYDFVMPNSKFNDYPKFGVWPDGYYMTDNQFDASNIFIGSGYFAFDRTKMLAGDPAASYVYFDSCPTNLNCYFGGLLPSDIDGFTPPPAGSPNTFVYFTANENVGDTIDGLRLFDFHVDFATPANSTFTERTGSPLPVAAFDPVVANISQPPPSTTTSSLDTLSDRLMFRLSYRNFGSSESLIVTHAVNIATPTPAHAGVRYYQLNRSTPSGPYVIAEQQTFSPDTTSRWMSSGAMNFQGDTAIGFSMSSLTVFPSIAYAAKLSTDPPGSGLSQGEQTIMAGTGTQSHPKGRWGDYSDLTVDPSDDCTFWFTQEYYATSGSAPWRTRIAKFAPGPCSTSPRGTIQGLVTSCSTGLPLTGASVEATGGFDRLTGSPGTYSMITSPGTYTVTASKFGYTKASTSSVVVANGGAATANVCLAPIAVLNASSPAVTTGNNLLEPNECNQLNIPVTNNGAATATAVSATLSSSTPGVTVKSANSAYPDIAVGGTQTNSTPFQISTNSSIACFSSINLTLTVNFSGGASPLIVNITLPIGRPAYSFTSSTGTITSTGTLVPGSEGDDALVSLTLPSGFATKVYGTSVTSMTADTNGNIRINATGLSAYLNRALPAAGDASELPVTTPVLLPYWDDLDMRPTITTGGGIYTDTTGQAPNRTFKVEWRARHYVAAQTLGPPDTNFAVILHENSNSFEYIYTLTGAGVNAGGVSATVGVQSASTVTIFTQFSFNTSSLTAGLQLNAAPPPDACSQGPGSCVTSTPVVVSGRVLTPSGPGLKNARVILTGPSSSRSVITNSFGFFNFNLVDPGFTYTINVVSKRFRFQSQTMQINDNLANLSFVGIE